MQQTHVSNPAAGFVPYRTPPIYGQTSAIISEVVNGARGQAPGVTPPETQGQAAPYAGAAGVAGNGLIPAGGGIVFLYDNVCPADEARRRGDSGDRSSSGSGSVSFRPIPSELQPQQQQQPQPWQGPAKLLPSHEFVGDGGSGDGRGGDDGGTRDVVHPPREAQRAPAGALTTSCRPQYGAVQSGVIPYKAERLPVAVVTETGGRHVQQGVAERLPHQHQLPTVDDQATLQPQQPPPPLPQQQDLWECQLLRTSSLTKAYLRLRPRAHQTASAGGARPRDESGCANGPFECLTSTAGPLCPILRTASSPARAMDWPQSQQPQPQPQQESLPRTQPGALNHARLEPSPQSNAAAAAAAAQPQPRRGVSGGGDIKGGAEVEGPSCPDDPSLPRVAYTFIRHASDSQVLAAREEQGYEGWSGLTSRELSPPPAMDTGMHRPAQPVLRLQPLRRSSSEISQDGGAVRLRLRTQVQAGRPSEAVVTATACDSSAGAGDPILELARREGVLEGMQGTGSKIMPAAAAVAAVAEAATGMMAAPSVAAPPPLVPQATAPLPGTGTSVRDVRNVDTVMVDAFSCWGPAVAPGAQAPQPLSSCGVVPPSPTGPKSQLELLGAHSCLGPAPQPMTPPSGNSSQPDHQLLLQQQQRLLIYQQQQQQRQQFRKASILPSGEDHRQSLPSSPHQPLPSGHTLPAQHGQIRSVNAILPPEHQHQHQKPVTGPQGEILPAPGQGQTQKTQLAVRGQLPPLQQLLQAQHQHLHQTPQPHHSQPQQGAPGMSPVPPRRAKSPRASLEIRSPAMSALQMSLIGTTNGGGGGPRGSDGGGGGPGGCRDPGVIPVNAPSHFPSQTQCQAQRPLLPWNAGTLGTAMGAGAPGAGGAVFNIDQLVVRQVQETTAAVSRSQRMSSSNIATMGPSGHPWHSGSPHCQAPVLTPPPGGSNTAAMTHIIHYCGCGDGSGGISLLPPTFAGVATDAFSASAPSMSQLNAPAITLTIPSIQGGGGNSSWNMATSYSDRATAAVTAPLASMSTAAVAVSTTGNNTRPARSSWTTGQLPVGMSVTPSPTYPGLTLAPTLRPAATAAVSTAGPDGSMVAARSHAAGFEMVDPNGGRVSGSGGGWTSCGMSGGGLANLRGTLRGSSLDVRSSSPTQVQQQRPQPPMETRQLLLRPPRSSSPWPLQQHQHHQPQQTEPQMLPPLPPQPPLGVEYMDTVGSLGPNTAASLYDSSTNRLPFLSATSNVALAGGCTMSGGNLGFQGLSLQHQGMLQSTAAGGSASNLVDGSGGGGGAACGVSEVFGGSPRVGSPTGHQVGMLPFQGGHALVSPAQSGAAGGPSAPLTPMSLGTDGGTTAPAAAATTIAMAGWGGSDVSAAAGSQPQLTGVWQSACMELQGGPNHGALMPYSVAAMDVTVEGGGEREDGTDPASGLGSAVLAAAAAMPLKPSNEGHLLPGMATGSSSSSSGVGGDLSGAVVF
ncbi:hypothetical protein Vafri_6922 [Volvox africanus]|nr:hypothetical protein Vafri_6922 [Volvox africanus]